jgi:UDP-3-O-[3-hydroxymyristoyl] glucosamine N-acyltransferase
MADGRLTAGAIAALVGGELIGPPDTPVAGAASLDEAGPGDVSFLASAGYVPLLAACRAAAVLVPPRFRDVPAGPAARIVVADPRWAIAQVLRALTPEPAPAWGVHPSVRIGRGTRWEGRIAVAAGAVLGEAVRLGRDCRVGAAMQLVTAVADGVNAAMWMKQNLRDPAWWQQPLENAL